MKKQDKEEIVKAFIELDRVIGAISLKGNEFRALEAALNSVKSTVDKHFVVDPVETAAQA